MRKTMEKSEKCEFSIIAECANCAKMTRLGQDYGAVKFLLLTPPCDDSAKAKMAVTKTAEAGPVFDLLHKYRDRDMELADACLVRMTELNSQCKIWTVDRGDFSVYRRHGRQMVPCEFPPK